MEVRYHRQGQSDLNEALDYYFKISPALEDDFYKEFKLGVQKVLENPLRYPFDLPNLRRYNFELFPYHFLYDISDEIMKIWVLRHDWRRPEYDSKKFAG